VTKRKPRGAPKKKFLRDPERYGIARADDRGDRHASLEMTHEIHSRVVSDH
jgi:hypothetical protein